jgi:hypothetical protein
MACADGRSSVSLPWCPRGLRDRQRAHDDAMAKIGLGAGWRGVGSRADSQTRGVSCLARSHDRTVLRGACAWCVETDPPCSTRAFPAARSAEAGGNNNNQISSVWRVVFTCTLRIRICHFVFDRADRDRGSARARHPRVPSAIPRACRACVAVACGAHTAVYQLHRRTRHIAVSAS